uniref:Plac8 onzin related protein 10 n=1 Tax=Pygocentrus nattereri TaxID=42514 RepID=A0A3B4EIF2_PYGNA
MAATTVVVQQAPKVVPKITSWSSGLCHCCQDMSSCCYAFWCCPCFACSTTSKFGLMSAFGMPVCVPPVTLSMRVAMRYKYQISGGICEDIAISCFCIWCSWCQMNREIQHRQRLATAVNAHTTEQVYFVSFCHFNTCH